jgi:hypothetical protein
VTSAFRKLIEGTILHRFQKEWECNIHNYQQGFVKKGFTVTQQIRAITRLATSQGTMFLDFKGAYDSVPRDLVKSVASRNVLNTDPIPISKIPLEYVSHVDRLPPDKRMKCIQGYLKEFIQINRPD